MLVVDLFLEKNINYRERFIEILHLRISTSFFAQCVGLRFSESIKWPFVIKKSGVVLHTHCWANYFTFQQGI